MEMIPHLFQGSLWVRHETICHFVDVSPLQDLVHSFQTDPEVRIAALSIEAASFVSNVPGTMLKRPVRNG